MAKSSYFYQPKKRANRPLDPVLVTQLTKITGYELVYGYRKVTVHIATHFNKKKVLRHMQQLKMTQPRKLKGERFTVLPYTPPTQSNERWEVDLTSVPYGLKTTAALFAVTDCFDHEIIGDNFTRNFTAQEARVALEMALFRRFPNGIPHGGLQLVVRVDRGSQFIAKLFKEAVRLAGLNLQFCGIQSPNDKPYIESFFSKYKVEEVYRNGYTTFDEALTAWQNYKFWYNTKRLHQSLGYRTPNQFAVEHDAYRAVGSRANWTLPLKSSVPPLVESGDKSPTYPSAVENVTAPVSGQSPGTNSAHFPRHGTIHNNLTE